MLGFWENRDSPQKANLTLNPTLWRHSGK